MRKRVQSEPRPSTAGSSREGALDVDKLASVVVTSESPEHPIEHALAGPTGRGSPRWLAAESGRQTITLAFDAPQRIEEVALEIEDLTQERTQELELAISRDGERSYQSLVRQEWNFSPSGSTWQHETWRVGQSGVTHLRLLIVPHKGGGESRASLTSVVLR
jgi:hypothetical protein